jgi:hypothetical protein
LTVTSVLIALSLGLYFLPFILLLGAIAGDIARAGRDTLDR